MGGTSAPFIAFPYSGGHIPHLSPSLSGVPQHFVGPNVNLFEESSQEIPPYNMSVGSTTFSLLGTFGNNSFSSAVVSARGNPGYGQPHLVHGTIPAQGAHLGIPSSQRPWNPWQGPVPLPGMSLWRNHFHTQWNPGKAQLYAHRINRGKPLPKSLECDANLALYVLLQEPANDVSIRT
jgi:hypothetical protein